MEKPLYSSVVIASFSLHFFVIVFSMTWIVGFARSSKASPLSSMAHYVLLAEHIEIAEYICFEKC